MKRQGRQSVIPAPAFSKLKRPRVTDGSVVLRRIIHQHHSLKKAVENRIKHGNSLKWRILMVAVVVAAIVAAGPVRAPLAQSSSDPWRFGITPYFWFINLEGNLSYNPIPGGSPHVDISNSDLLDSLDFGVMIAGEARKGRWAIFTDVIYLDLSSLESRVKEVDFNLGGPINPTSTALDAGTSSSLATWIWTLAGSYEVVEESAVTLEVLGGFRYFWADVSTDWQLTATITGPGPGQVFQRTGSISETKDLGRHCRRAGAGAAMG